MKSKKEVLSVKELGEELGYGHLMSLASALWRQSLKEKNFPILGAFVPTLDSFIKQEYKQQQVESSNNYDDIVEKALLSPLDNNG